MTAFNTDYNNTELLDQELNIDELQEINGGLGPAVALAIPIFNAAAAFIAGITIAKAEQENRKNR